MSNLLLLPKSAKNESTHTAQTPIELLFTIAHHERTPISAAGRDLVHHDAPPSRLISHIGRLEVSSTTYMQEGILLLGEGRVISFVLSIYDWTVNK